MLVQIDAFLIGVSLNQLKYELFAKMIIPKMLMLITVPLNIRLSERLKKIYVKVKKKVII